MTTEATLISQNQSLTLPVAVRSRWQYARTRTRFGEETYVVSPAGHTPPNVSVSELRAETPASRTRKAENWAIGIALIGGCGGEKSAVKSEDGTHLRSTLTTLYPVMG